MYVCIVIIIGRRKRQTTHAAIKYQYVGPSYCRAEMYAGRVACCPLVSHGEYADETDRQYRRTDGRTDERTPGGYVTLFARLGQRKNAVYRL